MPGHKRNKKFGIPASDIDITEISGFDNLHAPKETLLELQQDISRVFGYQNSIISVNGSTCCVLAAICAVCQRGDKIIIARNCHRSVYNACLLMELNTVYILPQFDTSLGAYTVITQNEVDKIIKENPDAKAVVITSPTYEGFISRIESPIPLIIDSAHGAHFGFSPWLPKRHKADIIIQSLHKTLPCLTQTAVIHINNEKYLDKVKMYMDIFESSSPSYVLLSSVDKCVDFLKNSLDEFNNYKKRLDRFYNSAQKLKNITLHKNDDITRIVISAHGYSGSEIAEILRSNGVEPESAALNHIILISTVADTDEGFARLLNALSHIEKRDFDQKPIPIPVLPKKVMNQSDIKHSKICKIKHSEGRICAEYIYAYPPGIPIIAPGEMITGEIIKYIKELSAANVNIISSSDQLSSGILTKAD